MNDLTCFAYVALGANLGDPMAQVEAARAALAALDGTQLVASSHWYRTRAIGPGEQPDYINGVVKLQTRLAPLALLHAMQAIEQKHGRQREVRWGARTLDLDLLLYQDVAMETTELTLPHPHLQERNFVVYPLADVAPDLILPSGVEVNLLRDKLGREGLERVAAAQSV